MTGWDERADVVIVGGGAAGLMAAATVASEMTRPVRVVVLEKDTSLGSSAEIGSGTVMAAGTRMQRAAGIDDSAAQLVADIMRQNGGASDPAVTEAVCAEAPQVVHWLCDRVGVPLELAMESVRIGHTRIRVHAHPTRSGRPVIGALREWVRRHAMIDFRDHSPGAELVWGEAGSLAGVVSHGANGTSRIAASAVVLAAGGFGANRDLVAEHLPNLVNVPYIGARGHVGDALGWGLKAGGALTHAAGYQGHGYCHPNTGTRITPGVIVRGGIFVNRHGQRFEREDRGYSEWATYVLRQPGRVAFAIWDERIHRQYTTTQAIVDSEAAGALVHAPDAATLAQALELPADALAATIEDYNRGVVNGRDACGREVLGGPLEPPFVAAATTGALAQTLGGLRTDAHARVLTTAGEAIVGLYAAGNTAAGVSGNDPAGYLSGSGLLTAFGLGRRASYHIASALSAHPR